MITIVGCGALGSLLAARLIEGGEQVQALQRKGKQLNALQQNGITIEGDKTAAIKNFRLKAVSNDPAQLKSSRLIIILVKAYDTDKVYPARHLLEKDSVMLTLQNGLGNAEKLSRMFGAENLMAGTATYGAYSISPGITGWGGDGDIIFGPWKKGLNMSRTSDLLKNAGLNISYVNDPNPAIWKKLAINAMVNTTSALTGMKNGEMLDNPQALEIMKRLGKETLAAADRAGVQLDFDEIWVMHMENLERTAANKPSMLQDIEAGRQTEVDAISGGVLKYSVNDEEFPCTRAVYSLLKAIDINRKQIIE